jgi:histidine triad (HIT) family protein
MKESNDCIFCKIAKGEVQCKKIYEDNDTFAFLSIAPEQPGHALVIPKVHARNIADCPSDVLTKTIASVQHVTKTFLNNGAKAVKVVQNNEKPLQEVFHLHFHVIPYGYEDK